MRLKDFLDQNDLSYTAFGELIGRSRLTVYRYTLPSHHPNHRRPTATVMRTIHAVTKGAVTPNDFLDLEDASHSEAAA